MAAPGRSIINQTKNVDALRLAKQIALDKSERRRGPVPGFPNNATFKGAVGAAQPRNIAEAQVAGQDANRRFDARNDESELTAELLKQGFTPKSVAGAVRTFGPGVSDISPGGLEKAKNTDALTLKAFEVAAKGLNQLDFDSPEEFNAALSSRAETILKSLGIDSNLPPVGTPGSAIEGPPNLRSAGGAGSASVSIASGPQAGTKILFDQTTGRFTREEINPPQTPPPGPVAGVRGDVVPAAEEFRSAAIAWVNNGNADSFISTTNDQSPETRQKLIDSIEQQSDAGKVFASEIREKLKSADTQPGAPQGTNLFQSIFQALGARRF